MTPELSEVIYPMLEEWDWLTPEQVNNMAELAESLVARRLDVALGILCARSVPFLKENNCVKHEP